MRNLNPTLWRTCRMLSGTTRIHLLHCLEERSGRNVSELARAVGVGLSAASQELRRIQSRGLLQAERRQASLIYRFGADPQVPSAAPILKALHAALSTRGPEDDERIQAIAHGLAHPKRIALLKSLMDSPKSAFALQKNFHLSFRTIDRHLRTLLESGLVRRENRTLHPMPPTHPLAKALLKLLPA
ncbi:MAG: ArsR family transcriptional regulator [Opitutae bacterium]|nr:ArsR family transcriptional regulator [Opitutae bacterium]